MVHARTRSPDIATCVPSGVALRSVDAATRAPSPDNNQPWRFRLEDGSVTVEHDRSRALPSDAGGLFSDLALGAALENLVLAARADGFEPVIRLLPADPLDPRDPVASVAFRRGGQRDPLVERIRARHTDRSPYRRSSLPGASLARLAAAASEADARCRVDWIVGRRDLGRLARLVVLADRIRFEHRPFHEELHRQLRLSAAEAERTGDGLDVRTLGAPPGAGWLLRFLRPWARMRALARLGGSRLLTLQSGMLVRACGAVAVLSFEGEGRPRQLAAGRALERLWLTADDEGLSVHPLGSLPVFLAHARLGVLDRLREEHATRVEGLARSLRDLVPVLRGRTLAMLLRVGRGHGSDVRSFRRPIGISVDRTDFSIVS